MKTPRWALPARIIEKKFMTRNNRGGPPHQAKHFQPEDHAHAAHQAEAPHGQAQKPGHGMKKGGKSEARKSGHPEELTPRGPSKGQ
jgi:hypothetical protein